MIETALGNEGISTSIKGNAQRRITQRIKSKKISSKFIMHKSKENSKSFKVLVLRKSLDTPKFIRNPQEFC